MILSLVRHEGQLAHSETLRETVHRPAVVQARGEVADRLEVHRGHVSQNDHLGRVLDESICLDLFGNRNERKRNQLRMKPTGKRYGALTSTTTSTAVIVLGVSVSLGEFFCLVFQRLTVSAGSLSAVLFFSYFLRSFCYCELGAFLLGQEFGL